MGVNGDLCFCQFWTEDEKYKILQPSELAIADGVSHQEASTNALFVTQVQKDGEITLKYSMSRIEVPPEHGYGLQRGATPCHRVPLAGTHLGKSSGALSGVLGCMRVGGGNMDTTFVSLVEARPARHSPHEAIHSARATALGVL